MRRASVPRKAKAAPEGLRPEYRFDHDTARPNRFSSLLHGDRVAVVLDPDVAAVFHSSESVNALLRSVITALPESTRATAAGE